MSDNEILFNLEKEIKEIKDALFGKKGEWRTYQFDDLKIYYCSNCGHNALTTQSPRRQYLTDYCPWCGKPMSNSRKDF